MSLMNKNGESVNFLFIKIYFVYAMIKFAKKIVDMNFGGL